MAASIYRIVGVHYTDLLDFLNSKSLNHGSIAEYFKTISSTDPTMIPQQSELMTKVANIVWAIDSLKFNSRQYWTIFEKNNRTIRTIMILMMVIIGLILMYILFYHEYPKLKEEDAPNTAKLKVILLFIIIYMITLTVLLTMEKNFHEKVRQGRNMKVDIDTDFAKFNSEILGIPEDLRLALLLMMYISRENVSESNKYRSALMGYASGKKTEKLFSPAMVDEIFPLNPKNRKVSVDRVQLFNIIKLPLAGTLTGFFDDGRGYIKMKKIIVSSNAIMMIREMKTSLTYHYSLVQRNVPDLEEEESDEKSIKLVKEIVIPKFSMVKELSDPHKGEEMDATEKIAVIQLNMQDATINRYVTGIVNQLAYFVYFVYPIYIKQNPMSPTFPVTSYINNMPQNEDISAIEIEDMKTIYGMVFEKHYNTYLQQAQASTGLAQMGSIITEMFNTHFKMLFKPMFIEASYLFQTPYIFIYDPEQIASLIKQTFASETPFSNIRDSDFLNGVTSIVGSRIVADLWDEFLKDLSSGSQLDTLKNDVVSDVSDALVKTPIKNLMKYKAVIMETSDNPKTTTIYNELTNKTDKLLQMKRATNTGNIFENATANRFITEEDFLSKIDQISFREVYSGFKLDYLPDIVNSFYVKISENSQASKRTLKDIYHTQQKTLDQVKRILWMVGFIMVFAFLYFWVTMYEDKKTTDREFKKEKDRLKDLPPSDPRLYILKRDHRNYVTYWWMKLILLGVSLVFLLVLFISFYKKSQAKFDYNRETIEANTAEFKTSLESLTKLMEDIKSSITSRGGSDAQINTPIGKLTNISKDHKINIMKKLIVIVDKYEKCNYINIANRTQFPFPYTEITMDLFMVITAIIILGYLTTKFKPLERISKIKDLNRKKEKVQYGEQDDELIAELNEYYGCHISDMEILMFVTKIIIFMFIVIFLLFYSSLIVSSSNEFKNGLYNSLYFEQSKCYDL